MAIYIECAPSMPAGRVVAAVGTAAWSAPVLLAMGPYLLSQPAFIWRRPLALVFPSIAWMTFIGAGAFVCGLVWRSTRRD